jgi:molecular chaperone GrpE
VVNDNESPQDNNDTTQDMAVDEPTVEQLQLELEKIYAELAETKDLMLRSKAEAENMRRRAKLDIENAHKYSIEKLAKELVHVVDSLEKGLEVTAEDSSQGKVESMRQGMELTHKLLLTTLEKFHIHQVDPQGEVFDPKQHEALTTQETTELEPNMVLMVVQKGFVIHDRVLRPARVIVSKAPAST